MEQLLPGVPSPLLIFNQRTCAHGAGDAGLESCGEWRQLELLAAHFGEDADAGQRAKDTIERRRLDPSLLR
jgi:hypothetical protein